MVEALVFQRGDNQCFHTTPPTYYNQAMTKIVRWLKSLVRGENTNPVLFMFLSLVHFRSLVKTVLNLCKIKSWLKRLQVAFNCHLSSGFLL